MSVPEENTVLTNLKVKLEKLLNRFDEQNGIINAYIQKERSWKSSKFEYSRQIEMLNDELAELKAEKLKDEWYRSSFTKNFW